MSDERFIRERSHDSARPRPTDERSHVNTASAMPRLTQSPVAHTVEIKLRTSVRFHALHIVLASFTRRGRSTDRSQYCLASVGASRSLTMSPNIPCRRFDEVFFPGHTVSRRARNSILHRSLERHRRQARVYISALTAPHNNTDFGQLIMHVGPLHRG
jgi:hypothetical protein